MKNKTFICICLLLFAITFASCDNKYSYLLPDPACVSPCWNGIKPGKTNEDQLVNDLNSMSIIEANSIITVAGPRYIFDNKVVFVLPLNIKGTAFIRDGLVELLLFSGKMGVTIGEFVGKIGEPEYIITYPTYVPFLFGDTENILVTVIFPSQGIAIDYDAGRMIRALHSEIKPERRIEGIWYFDPNILQEVLEDGMFTPRSLTLTDWQAKKLLQPWNGYGVIGEKYPLVDYK